MSETTPDLDQSSPSSAQVTPKEHPHLEWIRKEIAGEIHRQNSKEGDSKMCDSTISKDWIEQRIATAEARSDAKFEKLMGESNVKFEKLFGEMNAKFAQTETNIAKTEASHTKWMIGLTIATIAAITGILGSFLPSYKDIAQINDRFAVVDKQLDNINSRVNTVNVNLTELKSDIAQIHMSVKEQEKQKPKK